MFLGADLTQWTIRLALLCLWLMLAARLAPGLVPIGEKGTRWIWTIGGVLFLGHIASGMHFYHHWSHQHAYDETARQTGQMIGIAWGGGIYFNHLMAVLWVGDLLWMWGNPAGYWSRPRWINLLLFGFFLFIAINGTIVFKEGPIRWVSLLLVIILVLVTVLGRLTSKPDQEPPPLLP